MPLYISVSGGWMSPNQWRSLPENWKAWLVEYGEMAGGRLKRTVNHLVANSAEYNDRHSLTLNRQSLDDFEHGDLIQQTLSPPSASRNILKIFFYQNCDVNGFDEVAQLSARMLHMGTWKRRRSCCWLGEQNLRRHVIYYCSTRVQTSPDSIIVLWETSQ